jgi:DNA segregation ATPase FtsK/SpoIIIE-like protein
LIRFDLTPTAAVRPARLENLTADLAQALRTQTVWTGRDAGAFIEFENPAPEPVLLTALLPDMGDLSDATALFGLTVDGLPLLVRIASPSVGGVLITGGPGSGKSTLLRTVAASLLLTFDPETVQLAMIDPGGNVFPNALTSPHLLRPVLRESSAAVALLRDVARLVNVRQRGNERTPVVVILVDELDTLLSGPIPGHLRRILDAGQGVGVHVVAAMQRHDGWAGAFPLRIVGQDLGRGDFLAVQKDGEAARFQAAYIELDELKGVTKQ